MFPYVGTDAQPIIPPDLREKPRTPVNSNVEQIRYAEAEKTSPKMATLLTQMPLRTG